MRLKERMMEMRMKPAWALLVLVLVYLVMMLLIWPPLPIERLAFFPILFGIIFFKPVIEKALSEASRERRLFRIVIGLAAVAILVRGGVVLYRLFGPNHFMDDIAHAYKECVRFFFAEGANPYVAPVDPKSFEVNGVLMDYPGLKYTPLQLLTYGPFILLFGMKGIYVGNLVAYVGMGWVIWSRLRRFSVLHAVMGIFFLAVSDHVAVLCFNNGSNDVMPTFLMLLGLQALQQGREHVSGIWLGLSFLAKQLPGALVILSVLVQRHWRTFGFAVLVTILGCLPFLILSPVEFYRNVLEFNLKRPVRDSSWLYFLPAVWSQLVQLAGILTWVMLSVFGNWKPRWALVHGDDLVVIGLFVFLVTAKLSQFHYFLWVTPFLILWILEPKTSRTNRSPAR